jgi:hypothetical protein
MHEEGMLQCHARSTCHMSIFLDRDKIRHVAEV